MKLKQIILTALFVLFIMNIALADASFSNELVDVTKTSGYPTQVSIYDNVTLAFFVNNSDNGNLTFALSQTNSLSEISCLLNDSGIYCAGADRVSYAQTDLSVNVTDVTNGGSDVSTFTVTINDTSIVPNHAPVFTAELLNITKTTGYPATLSAYDIATLNAFVFDNESDALTFSIANQTNAAQVPCYINTSGLFCQPVNGVTYAQNDITVSVTDTFNANSTSTFTFTLNDSTVNVLPVFTAELLNITKMTGYPATLSAYDIATLNAFVFDNESDALTFSIANQTNAAQVPCYMNASGLFCQPADEVEYAQNEITVKVTDTFNGSATSTFTFTVNDSSVNVGPVFVSNLVNITKTTTGATFSAYGMTTLASFVNDSDGDVLTFSISNQSNNASIPCNLNTSGIFCTPSETTFNDYTDLTVQVSDGNKTAESTFSFIVNVPFEFENFSISPNTTSADFENGDVLEVNFSSNMYPITVSLTIGSTFLGNVTVANESELPALFTISGVSDGTYALTYNVTGPAGNVNGTYSTITIDTPTTPTSTGGGSRGGRGGGNSGGEITIIRSSSDNDTQTEPEPVEQNQTVAFDESTITGTETQEGQLITDDEEGNNAITGNIAGTDSTGGVFTSLWWVWLLVLIAIGVGIYLLLGRSAKK